MIGIKNKHEKVKVMKRDLVTMIETTHSLTHHITDLVYILCNVFYLNFRNNNTTLQTFLSD